MKVEVVEIMSGNGYTLNVWMQHSGKAIGRAAEVTNFGGGGNNSNVVTDFEHCLLHKKQAGSGIAVFNVFW